MTRYVAFLRAVNVGGRQVKMEVLRALFEQAGFKNVKTYIQSGNVIFDAAGKGAALEPEIERLLAKNLGFEVPACIRSVADLQAVLNNNPYPGIVPDKDLQIYIAFLQTLPGDKAAAVLETMQSDIETYRMNGKEVYVLMKKNMGAPPFSNNYLEKKLGLVATTRNLATVQKVSVF
ncbi:DUF1697 domain-containing protein [Chitinophaga oryzae]|uniref:DUF1697 domain-containing protein n=1 Tax=Chitinophaga oryzae TaxID=2725414 RepID=A0AAE7DB72_9BACT|nr:DUF1697 domain-containing protein [Chitinophaga oryzae]QJB35089.1 DUF1697 domain-containing protein [Chitinophaga oryzae]QJB41606.1 DUF1697 domain-containing protein [Chitinophaga oryzae]